MSEYRDALAWAEAQVAAAREDPAARLALLARTYHGPTGCAPRRLPFRRAALSFMRWQVHRGLLSPLDASPSGSVWSRAPTSAVPAGGAVVHALAGAPRSAQSARRVAVGQRLVAGDERAPAARRLRSDRAGRGPQWRSIVAGRTAVAGVHRHPDTVSLVPGPQRQHRGRLPGARRLAEEESAPERFFMNVALARALRTRPRCAPAPGAGALRSAGPHVEHAAPPPAEHLGQEPSRQRHERAAVELDLMADLLRIPVDEAARIRNAGVVDQPADTPWAARSSSAICSRRSGYPARPSAAARPTPPTPRVMRRGRSGWPELRPRRSAALTSLARTRRDPR
jgi:hypothetical protein